MDYNEAYARHSLAVARAQHAQDCFREVSTRANYVAYVQALDDLAVALAVLDQTNRKQVFTKEEQ